MRKPWLVSSFLLGALSACGSPPPPATPLPVPAAVPAAVAPPCVITISETELRAKDGAKILDDLVRRIRLPPEDDALREPKSMADVQKILRRDTVYLFPAAAGYARALSTKEGRQTEATIELLMGESQMLAAQVINLQEAWVASDYRIARATLATEVTPSSDRNRLLTQLVRVVDDGSAISAALNATAPTHIARGAEVVRALKTEAPTDSMTLALIAEYHRLRGEWPEFEAAIAAAEAAGEKDKPATRYLRGMEQMERFHRRDQAMAMMREALKAYPRFVRAQAALVLMANNPRSALRELQKLKAMNQDHYLVMLLEPTLAADHELGRIENATGQGGGDGN